MQQYVDLGHAALAPLAREAERNKASEELSRVVSSSHEPIMTATTVFPFKFFPDTVIVDRSKLCITHRTFFWSAEVTSIKIEDILNVTASVALFFGSVQIHTKYFDPQRPYVVSMLWREDALKISRIMQGYGIALREAIDLSAMDTDELAQKLDELGKNAPSGNV